VFETTMSSPSPKSKTRSRVISFVPLNATVFVSKSAVFASKSKPAYSAEIFLSAQSPSSSNKPLSLV
jgi:hypothetical protein